MKDMPRFQFNRLIAVGYALGLGIFLLGFVGSHTATGFSGLFIMFTAGATNWWFTDNIWVRAEKDDKQ